ncbi:MAG: nuclear transport factor 2 family protein [Halobacteriaceae archaeon]
MDGDAASADRAGLARRYYRALDDGEYGTLRSLLADDFRQERGDRTLDGADRFVRFMRDQRPETDTSHDVDAVYEGGDGVAVEGRLRHADGSPWFAFVDVFTVADGRLESLRTYTRSPDG